MTMANATAAFKFSTFVTDGCQNWEIIVAKMDPILMSLATSKVSDGSMIILKNAFGTTAGTATKAYGGVCVAPNLSTTENAICIAVTLAGAATAADPALTWGFTMTRTLMNTNTTPIKASATAGEIKWKHVMADYSPDMNWQVTNANALNTNIAGG